MAQPRPLEVEPPPIVRIADGVWAEAADRSAPLPRHLDSGAHEGRIGACRCRPLLEAMRAVRRFPVAVAGTRLACRDEHDLVRFVTGVYAGMELRLAMCRFCGAIEVRDVSLDLLIDEDRRTGARRFITPQATARRRDAVLGWYAGRRQSGRLYR